MTATIAEGQQTSFDFLMPYKGTLLEPRQVAATLKCGLSHVYVLVDEKALEAHTMARGEVASAWKTEGDKEARKNNRYRITRRSVLVRMLETANYEPADLVPRVAEILATLTPAQYQAALAQAGQLRAKL